MSVFGPLTPEQASILRRKRDDFSVIGPFIHHLAGNISPYMQFILEKPKQTRAMVAQVVSAGENSVSVSRDLDELESAFTADFINDGYSAQVGDNVLLLSLGSRWVIVGQVGDVLEV